MQVIINGLSAFGPRTGVGHYTAQLLRCLRQQMGEHCVTVFPSGWLGVSRRFWKQVRPLLEQGSGVSSWRKALLCKVRQAGGELLRSRFRKLCEGQRFALYHEPNFLPLASELPTLVTVHDLSVLRQPEWHPVERVHHFEREFGHALSQAVHLVTVSDSVRQELISALGIPPDRVSRVYNGVRPGLRRLPQERTAQRLRALGLPERYLLYVGTIEPRKNLLRLMQAYCSCPDGLRSQWPLLLVGPWGWNAGPVADYYEKVGRHRGVHQIGYVKEADLTVLYNGARALLYPSYYEGFGMPPMEMLACGGAVIASTADALRETVGHKAHLVDPKDADGWRAAMLRVTTDGEWWAGLRDGAVEAAGDYTWDRCAAQTLNLYRRLTRSDASTLVASN